MDSTRQQKVARLIHRELAEVLQREGQGMVLQSMVTVTEVRITPDLSIARVFISVFPPDKRQAVLQQVNDAKKDLRMKLASRVRNQLRVVPDLHFFIDDTLDQAERIDALLKS